MLALIASLYLLLRVNNSFSSNIYPPLRLRRWAVAFMASIVLSHIWWVVLTLCLLADDRPLRNVIAIGLDALTLVPTMMATLLCLLQDRRRPLWPVAAVMLPVVVAVIGLGIVMRSELYELVIQVYELTIGMTFIIYMVYAVRQYGRWLRDNYADLEHKEVWQSLILLSVILFMLVAYKTNYGGLIAEYVTQINTVVLVGFLLWRVETLQLLQPATEPSTDTSDLSGIGNLLERHCEQAGLYLQHDLTLQQLATALGTNRTYLSAYFSQVGTTYNAYINLLRIKHLERLYQNALTTQQPVTAQTLALQSGFRSYSTFGAAFKKFRGIAVTTWMRECKQTQLSELTTDFQN